MTRQAAGAVDVAGIEPKQMLMGLVRKSAMLSRMKLHEEP
jgi:hypothetical protein